jgi:hypothetical protein
MVVYTLAKQDSIGMRISLVIEKVTFQYVVDVVENDDISTPMASLPGVCGDTCPTFGDDTTTTNGFSIAHLYDEDGKLQTRFRLPNSTSTEPMFYTVSRTKSNAAYGNHLEHSDVPDGTFRLWIDGLLVKEDLRVLYRYYDDIFIRSMSLQTDGSISRTFKYWVGECDIQSVLIDDVLPGRSGCSR